MTVCIALCRFDFDQSGSIDWGVIPSGLEEAMTVRITLCRSCEDSARPTVRFVRRGSIASAQRALGSSRAGSSRSGWSKNLAFPITGPPDYDSHSERVARREKERIRVAKARITDKLTVEAAHVAARAAVEEEAIQAHILKKRRSRNMHALAQEQNRMVRELAELLQKEEKEASNEKI
ncbi:E3 ubiquitin-protein ligase XB3 [Hordeum vulgare]|nr:E3 ubiquitin-protein ligase XB3 [Hordeum vulgare]